MNVKLRVVLLGQKRVLNNLLKWAGYNLCCFYDNDKKIK